MKLLLLPGGEELHELVGLLVSFGWRLLKVVRLLRGLRQVPAAAAQADAGGGGGGAEARVGHWGGLALPQEVEAS